MQLFHKDRWIKITIYFCWVFSACCCCLLSRERERESKKHKHDTAGHIHFVFDWMIFMAAFFRTVADAAAAAISIEQQFVIEQSTFRSHFVSNSMHYGTECWTYRRRQRQRWRRLVRLFVAMTGQDHSLELRDGGLTYHSKSNRLFWIIDKLSLWVLDLISGDISNCSTKCVCIAGVLISSCLKQTHILNCGESIHTHTEMDHILSDSLDLMNLIWFVFLMIEIYI